jgi:restriction endonuclease Mrr
MTDVKLPMAKDLLLALLQVLASDSGPISVADIELRVSKSLGLSEKQLAIMRSGNRSEFFYRLAWERTHAKNKGLATRRGNSCWEITELGREHLVKK